MVWFRVEDGIYDHPKMQGIPRADRDPRRRALDTHRHLLPTSPHRRIRSTASRTSNSSAPCPSTQDRHPPHRDGAPVDTHHVVVLRLAQLHTTASSTYRHHRHAEAGERRRTGEMAGLLERRGLLLPRLPRPSTLGEGRRRPCWQPRRCRSFDARTGVWHVNKGRSDKKCPYCHGSQPDSHDRHPMGYACASRVTVCEIDAESWQRQRQRYYSLRSYYELPTTYCRGGRKKRDHLALDQRTRTAAELTNPLDSKLTLTQVTRASRTTAAS